MIENLMADVNRLYNAKEVEIAELKREVIKWKLQVIGQRDNLIKKEKQIDGKNREIAELKEHLDDSYQIDMCREE